MSASRSTTVYSLQVAGQAAHLDVVLLADDDRVAPFADQLHQRQVDALDQRAGGVVDLVSLVAQSQLDLLRGAVRRQQHGARLHLLGGAGADGAGGVHARHHVGVVDEVAQDGQRSLPRQAHRQLDGVAHAETHPHVLRHSDFHNRSPPGDCRSCNRRPGRA